MTFCVTLPLAALFCIGMRFTLISLVGAVVIGYSTTGLFLGYLLQMSDWEHISKIICAINESDDMDSSSDDDSDDNDDDFEDNIPDNVVSITNKKSTNEYPDTVHIHNNFNVFIESLQRSEEERLRLATCLENIQDELLVLADQSSTQTCSPSLSKRVDFLTDRIVDLEAQVLEKDAVIKNLKEEVSRIQQLYGRELSDLLGRIKTRVRQTSDVLLGGGSDNKSHDISFESSSKEEI